MITSMCQHMTSSAVGLYVFFFNAYRAWFYSSSISDITSIPFTLSSLCSISTDKLSTVLCEPSLLHPVFTQFCHFPFHSSSSCCYGFCSLFSDLNDCILKQLLYYYLYTFNCPFRPVWSLFLKFILNLLTFQYVCDFFVLSVHCWTTWRVILFPMQVQTFPWCVVERCSLCFSAKCVSLTDMRLCWKVLLILLSHVCFGLPRAHNPVLIHL